MTLGCPIRAEIGVGVAVQLIKQHAAAF